MTCSGTSACIARDVAEAAHRVLRDQRSHMDLTLHKYPTINLDDTAPEVREAKAQYEKAFNLEYPGRELKWGSTTVSRTIPPSARPKPFATKKGNICGLLALNNNYDLPNGQEGQQGKGYIWDGDEEISYDFQGGGYNIYFTFDKS